METATARLVERLLLVLGLAAAALAVWLIALLAWNAPAMEWNLIRLSPAVAALHGDALYPAVASGAINGHIYTPGSAWFYMPVAWIGDATAMVRAGSLLTLGLTLVPLVLIIRAAPPSEAQPGASIAWVVVAAFLVAVFLPDLRYAMSAVHAEGPALGFMGLAVALALTRPGWAGACAVSAVFCKQTWAPGWLALGGAMLWLHSRAQGWHYLKGSLIAGALGGVALVATNSLEAFWFNCVTLPAHHPWTTAGYAFSHDALAGDQNITARLTALTRAGLDLMGHAWPGLVVVVGCVVARLAGQRLPSVAVTASLVALAQLPLALASFVKLGGGANVLAPFSGPVLWAAAALAATSLGRVATRPWWLAALAVLIALNVPRAAHLARQAGNQDPYRAMLAYLHDHPGETYLPWNPYLTWAAEQRWYHFEYGVFDRWLAGRPITAAHYAAHLPDHLRWVALRRDQPPSAHDTFRRYLALGPEAASPPGLEAWAFFPVRSVHAESSLALP